MRTITAIFAFLFTTSIALGQSDESSKEVRAIPVVVEDPTFLPERIPQKTADETDIGSQDSEEKRVLSPIDQASPYNISDASVSASDEAGSLEDQADPRSEILRYEKAWELQPLSDRAIKPLLKADLKFETPSQSVELLPTHRSDIRRHVHWSASNLYSQPTYFDDVDLEIYGHSHCLQPLKSGIKFYSDLVFLPAEVCKNRPRECIYQLGFERPGNCAPSIRERRWYNFFE